MYEVSVNMFHFDSQIGLFPHHYDADLDCDILGLPYKQNATTMYVLMPKTSNPTSLRKLQKELTPERFESMVNNMRLKTAVILFPKMHLSSGLHLKPELKQLGAETLFDDRCDLSVMSRDSGEAGEPQFLFDQKYNTNRTTMYYNNNCTIVHINSRAEEGDQPQGKRTQPSQPCPATRNKRDVKYKVESEHNKDNPLRMKDFILNKRIVKKNGLGKKLKRSKRAQENSIPQQSEFSQYTKKLEEIRKMPQTNPHIFAEEVIHKVDLTINEKGTEGGAATAITLNRSGTNVVFRVDAPFMFVIRHDPTHIPLFYGVVFKPEK